MLPRACHNDSHNFPQTTQKQDRTLSGLLEKRKLLPETMSTAEQEAGTGSQTGEALALERYFSTPPPQVVFSLTLRETAPAGQRHLAS